MSADALSRTVAARSSVRPRARALGPYLLAAPAVLVLILTVGGPVVQLLSISLQDYGIRAIFSGAGKFVGLDNYRDIFSSPDVLQVFLRTAGFAGALVAGNMVLGTSIAMFIQTLGKRMRLAVLSALMLSWAMPSIGAVLIWQWMFQPLYGVVNWLLTRLVVFGDMTQYDWTANTLSAFFIVWLLIVWKSVPFVVVTVYAARSQLPPDIYEAAKLDGASSPAAFALITLPLIAPTLFAVLTLETIWDFNIFSELWILTSGGPDGSTITAGIWMFIEGFNKSAYGLGAAMALTVAIVLCGIAATYARRMVRSVDVQ